MQIKLSKETENMLQQIEDKKTRNVYRSYLKDQLEFQGRKQKELEENRKVLEELNKKQLDHNEIIKEAIRSRERAKELVRRIIKLSEEWAKEYEENYRKCESWIKEKIDNGEKIIG